MIISHSHRFIFIHVHRVGGSSVTQALAPYQAPAGPSGKLARLVEKIGLQRDPKKMSFRMHATAREVRRKLPAEIWDGYYKFAFVRNPWDWLVSLYFRIRGTPSHRHHERVMALPGFSEYLDFEIERNVRFQSDLVADRNDKLLVDFLGRHETFAADFAQVCKHLDLTVELPHTGQRPHKPFQEYYDEACREKVARHWARDIELFDYTFDVAASTPGTPQSSPM